MIFQLGELGLAQPALVYDSIAASADPQQALATLQRLLEAGSQGSSGDAAALRHCLDTSQQLRQQLSAVLGASIALGDHLVARAAAGEADWLVLSEPAHGFGTESSLSMPLPTCDVESLRAAYRRRLLSIAAADVSGALPVMQTASALSELADATLVAALRMTGVSESARPEAALTESELTVIALGKCGARELNYVSDVDVMFVIADSEPIERATAVAQRLMQTCREVAWQLDAELRPEGHHGALARTVDSYRAYYQRWAHSWEFQALLKARWAASTVATTADSDELARRWAGEIAPMVWQAAGRPGFVADAQAMRQRVRRHAGPNAVYDIKLGPGGLRDIEFAVQLLQLVHGRTDHTLRASSTVTALDALTQGGYVGRTDGAALRESYCFLRRIEHRLQLRGLRRTHRLPTDGVALRWLARSLGYHLGWAVESVGATSAVQRRGDPVERFLADWRRHGARVEQLHEKLFYRPLLTAVARLPSDALGLGAPTLTSAAAAQRLAALGFNDPVGALRHVAALSSGVSRSAAIQRSLLPVILAELADTANPDSGLLAYRRVSEQLGRSPWFLRLMRDGDVLASRVARVLGSSRYVADLLEHDAQGLSLLAGDDLMPRTPQQLSELLHASTARALSDPGPALSSESMTSRAPSPRLARSTSSLERAFDVLSRRRAHELLRIASADVCGLIEVADVGQALSDLTDAVIAVALEAVCRKVAERSDGQLPIRLAVIAMGRYGGHETGFASDADVMFVYEPGDSSAGTAADAAAAAQAVVTRLMHMLSRTVTGPALALDADLRPEGRGGPLALSLAGYERYYQGRSRIWEAQALLRARTVAGDPLLREKFVQLIVPVRYPDAGLDAGQLRELRRMKARVDTERLPRGADPATHLKLGRGALTDVEWTVQLLQLRHAHRHCALQTPRTLEALNVARDVGLIASSDYDALAASWTLAARVRNAATLVRGKATDQLPTSGRELLATAQLVARHTLRDAGEFVDHYLRTTRRARQAIEKISVA